MDNNPNPDPEFAVLERCADALKAKYAADDSEWRDSSFRWLKGIPSRTVGRIGEELVECWLTHRHVSVARSGGDTDADRVINGKRAEIKLSTLWKGGFYKFQQIRDQRYDYLVCIGLSPFDAHCWVIPKVEAFKRIGTPGAGIVPQHGGKAGTDTAWLEVRPGTEPAWLHPYGGRLENALAIMRKWGGSRQAP